VVEFEEYTRLAVGQTVHEMHFPERPRAVHRANYLTRYVGRYRFGVR
jgi:hypothetical protein